MRIAIALERFEPQRGGLEQWAWQFVRWLSGKDHQIHLVASSFGPEANDLKIHQHRIELAPERMARAAEFERCLRTLPVDIIHDLGSGYYFDIYHPHFGSRIAGFRQDLRALPLAERIGSFFSADRRRRYRELRALERVQYRRREGVIIAVSRMVQRDLEQLHGVMPGQIELIYNGVDVERFSPAHRALHRNVIRSRLGLQNELLFLLVAHNFSLKGVDTALKAMRLLKRARRDACLAIVGRGRIGEYRKRARHLEVDKSVTFCGAVESIEHYFAAADVYVHPTYYDPCSLTALEALASGLPVVTTQFNGVSELMTGGTHGYVLSDPGNAEELARKMDLLFDEHPREQMGAAARTLAMEHSFDRNCESILSLYQRKVRQRGASHKSETDGR